MRNLLEYAFNKQQIALGAVLEDRTERGLEEDGAVMNFRGRPWRDRLREVEEVARRSPGTYRLVPPETVPT